MSLTVQQILLDANRLVSRLRDHDSAADMLVSQTENLYKHIDSMKQYQEDLVDLNTSAIEGPRSVIAAGLQQENRHIRELQQENKELRLMLEEHQNTLELVMSKYRHQISKLLAASKNQVPCNHQEQDQVLQSKVDQICDMVDVMSRSMQMDDEAVLKEREAIQQLVSVNKGLRELLNISVQYGSYNMVPQTKAVQIDGLSNDTDNLSLEDKVDVPTTDKKGSEK